MSTFATKSKVIMFTAETTKLRQKSFRKWEKACKAKDFEKLLAVTGPFSVDTRLRKTLERVVSDRPLYRKLVKFYWGIANDLSLFISCIEDFELFDSLGYDFTKLQDESFTHIIENDKLDLLRKLLSWRDIVPDEDWLPEDYIVGYNIPIIYDLEKSLTPDALEIIEELRPDDYMLLSSDDISLEGTDDSLRDVYDEINYLIQLRMDENRDRFILEDAEELLALQKPILV